MRPPEHGADAASVAGRLVAAAGGTRQEFHREIRSARQALAGMPPQDERTELLGAILQPARRPTPEGCAVRLRLLRHLAATAAD